MDKVRTKAEAVLPKAAALRVLLSPSAELEVVSDSLCVVAVYVAMALTVISGIYSMTRGQY